MQAVNLVAPRRDEGESFTETIRAESEAEARNYAAGVEQATEPYDYRLVNVAEQA